MYWCDKAQEASGKLHLTYSRLGLHHREITWVHSKSTWDVTWITSVEGTASIMENLSPIQVDPRTQVISAQASRMYETRVVSSLELRWYVTMLNSQPGNYWCSNFFRYSCRSPGHALWYGLIAAEQDGICEVNHSMAVYLWHCMLTDLKGRRRKHPVSTSSKPPPRAHSHYSPYARTWYPYHCPRKHDGVVLWLLPLSKPLLRARSYYSTHTRARKIPTALLAMPRPSCAPSHTGRFPA